MPRKHVLKPSASERGAACYGGDYAVLAGQHCFFFTPVHVQKLAEGFMASLICLFVGKVQSSRPATSGILPKPISWQQGLIVCWSLALVSLPKKDCLHHHFVFHSVPPVCGSAWAAKGSFWQPL